MLSSKVVLLFTLVLAALVSLVVAQDPITATTSAESSYTVSYIESVPDKVDYTATGAPFGNGYNGVREIQEIGFAFPFYGVTYTTVGIGYNGNLQWGTSAVSGLIPASIPTSAISIPILAWFAADLNCVQSLCGGGYGYVGQAPFRQFILRAVNWTFQATTSTGFGDLDVDVVLFESTGRIEIRYYSVSPLPSSEFAVTVGVQKSTSDWVSVLSANATIDTTTYLQGRTIVFEPVPTASSLSSSSVGPLPSSSVMFSPASTGDSTPRPDIAYTTGGSPYYSVLTADSVAPKVSFNYTGSPFSTGSNGVRENQNIGFPFQFFGKTYTRIGIGYNGNLQWNSSAVSGILPAGIPSATQTFPIFAWFAADLNCVPGVCAGGYGLIGEAPYRQFIVRVENWTYQNTASTGQGDIDIDIVLTETDNTIAVRYYSVSPLPTSTYRVTIGAQNAQNDDWTSVFSRSTNFDVQWYLQGRTLIFVPDSL